uniref:C2H2-type domain-containing protein n=1 Tax=Ascaris lumbricoides TaxID=6252 RepID=A0A0M3HRA8_ASCLU
MDAEHTLPHHKSTEKGCVYAAGEYRCHMCTVTVRRQISPNDHQTANRESERQPMRQYCVSGEQRMLEKKEESCCC